MLNRFTKAMEGMKTRVKKKTSLYVNNLGNIFHGTHSKEEILGKDVISINSRSDWFIARNLLKTPSNINEGYSLHIYKAEGNLAWKHKKQVQQAIQRLQNFLDLQAIAVMPKAELDILIEKYFLNQYPGLATRNADNSDLVEFQLKDKLAKERSAAIDALSEHLTWLSFGKIFDIHLHSNSEIKACYNDYKQTPTQDNLDKLAEEIAKHFPGISNRFPRIDPERRPRHVQHFIKKHLREWFEWKAKNPKKPYQRDYISVNTRYGDAYSVGQKIAPTPAPSSRHQKTPEETKPNNSPRSQRYVDKPSPRRASPGDEKSPNPRRRTLEKKPFSPGDYKSGISPQTSRNAQLAPSDDEKVLGSPRSQRTRLDPRDLYEPEYSRMESISVSALPATIEIKKPNIPAMPRRGNVVTKNPLFWTDAVVEGIVQSVFALLSELGDSRLVFGVKIVVAIPLMPTLVITNGVTRGTTGLFEALKKGFKLLGRYLAEKCASDEEVQPFECVQEEAPPKPLTPPSPAPVIESSHAAVALSLQIEKVPAKSEEPLIEHDEAIPNVPLSSDKPLSRAARLAFYQSHRPVKSSLGNMQLNGVVQNPDGLTLQLEMVPKS